MTLDEILRRLAPIEPNDLRLAHRAALDGFGASGIVHGVAPRTLKQANAVCEWVEHFDQRAPAATAAGREEQVRILKAFRAEKAAAKRAGIRGAA